MGPDGLGAGMRRIPRLARPLRHGDQARGGRRPGRHAGRRLGPGPPLRPAVPGPRPAVGGDPPVRLRPLVQHHGGQPHVDDGGGVRLRPRRPRLPRLHRPHGAGGRDGPRPGLGGAAPRPDGPLPPPGGVLRPGRNRCGPPAAPRTCDAALVGRNGGPGRTAGGVLGAAVLVAQRPPQRHGLDQADALPVLPLGPREPGGRLPRERPAAAAGAGRGPVRCRPLGAVPTPPRHGARRDRRAAAARLHPPPRGSALQRADPPGLLPVRLPPGRPRRGRGAAPVGAPARRPGRTGRPRAGRIRCRGLHVGGGRDARPAAARPAGWLDGRQLVPVAGSRDRGVEPRTVVGTVELRRLRGPHR